MAQGTITIEKPFGGWIDVNSSSVPVLEGRPDQYTNSASVDLFRPGLTGHLAPGIVFDAVGDATSVINELPKVATKTSDGKFFAILANARIARITSNATDATGAGSNATAHGGGGHTPLTGEDILAYQDATDEYVLYSFNDPIDGDVGRYTKSTGAYDDDFMSTVPTTPNLLNKSYPHPMVLSPGKNIYIGNGNVLAKYDPGTNTFTLIKLTLGAGWIISALSTYQNYVVIIAYQKTTTLAVGQSMSFLWDEFSPTYNFSYDLFDDYATECIGDGKNIYVFTRGKNLTTKIKYFTGDGWEMLCENAQIGSTPNRGGADLVSRSLVFTDPSQNKIFRYLGGLHSPALAETSAGSASSVGFIKNLSQNILYIGCKIGANYQIIYSNFSNYSTSATWRSGLIVLPYQSIVKRINFYFSQFGTGASFIISGFSDYTAVSVGDGSGVISGADLINRTISKTLFPNTMSVSIESELKNISAFYLYITWNHALITNAAAIIRKIEIIYDTTNRF